MVNVLFMKHLTIYILRCIAPAIMPATPTNMFKKLSVIRMFARPNTVGMDSSLIFSDTTLYEKYKHTKMFYTNMYFRDHKKK